MKNVLYAPGIANQSLMPIKLTHYQTTGSGWIPVEEDPLTGSIVKILYLGKCPMDGDMFAVYYDNEGIVIFKGHLNSGTY